MIEIIPAILTDSPEQLVRLVHVFERLGFGRIQLDICDGVFVPTRTIVGYEELSRLACVAKFDVHLMVQEPEQACGHWCTVACADRFFLHVETVKDFATLCEHAMACGKKLVAAINPGTPIEKLEAVVPYVDTVQFLTIQPGAQGSAFVPDVLENIKTFHAAHPDIIIAVDGGINPDTAPQCIAAGASVLVVGSYLARSLDPAVALRELQNSLS